MPHRFGNQKPASDFVIKTQKPMSKNKWDKELIIIFFDIFPLVNSIIIFFMKYVCDFKNYTI